MRRAIIALSVWSCMLLTQPLQAQTTSGQTNADIRQPITVVKNSDLNFGSFIAGTATSEFRIDAVTASYCQK